MPYIHHGMQRQKRSDGPPWPGNVTLLQPAALCSLWSGQFVCGTDQSR